MAGIIARTDTNRGVWKSPAGMSATLALTWLLVSLDPADGDTAYGLIDLGISMPELGTVKLSDLASIVGPRQQPVMRDRYFRAVRPLSEYLRLAQENGSVLD